MSQQPTQKKEHGFVMVRAMDSRHSLGRHYNYHSAFSSLSSSEPDTEKRLPEMGPVSHAGRGWGGVAMARHFFMEKRVELWY